MIECQLSGTKIGRFTILGINHVDVYHNKVYACSCDECSSKQWLGNPVFTASIHNIQNLMCWCDRRFHFDPKQREKLVRKSLVKTGYKLHMVPPKKEEWHRESEVMLLCPLGHETFNKIGELMFGKPKCDVCEGIKNKKPKHLAVDIVDKYAKRNGYTIKQVSGWAGESTQYQVTCKIHKSFDLSLRRIKSNSICPCCATYA